MLRLKNITYKEGNKLLLNNVSIAADAGKLNLIVGPNGAGKSTLIKIIGSQLKPQQGAVYYDDKLLNTFSKAALARMRAVLSQNIELAFPMKVSEVVMLGRYPHFTGKPGAKDIQACEAAMQYFNILDISTRNYLTLSGGEKQRVHFARVMAQIWYPVNDRCRYLFLDEPLTYLDVYHQFDFINKLLLLLKTENIVVVGVVHDLNLAARFADTIILLNNGNVVAAGNANHVFTKENIKSVYNLDPVFYYDNETLRLFFN